MSNYYVRREGDDSDYLEHSIFQKGYHGSHKYIARMNIGGKMRYFYDPRELSVFKAGGRAASAVGGAVANVRRKGLGRAVADATGLTARRAYQSAKKARIGAASSRGGSQNVNLQRAAGRAKKAYNKTLLGRIENAGNAAGKFVGRQATRAVNAGNAARNFIGQQANRARTAGESFAGTVSKEAYRVGRRTTRKVKGLFTPKKAPRKPAKEVNVRDYAKINRGNEKSAEQYQYFNKDAGWATNSRSAAKRLTGHTTHNRTTAKRKRRAAKRRSQSQFRTVQ